MDERLFRLERTVRWMALALLAFGILQAVAALRPQAPAGGQVAPASWQRGLLPRAHAEGQILKLASEDERPPIMFTTSQSGASLYEWRWDAEERRYQRVFYP